MTSAATPATTATASSTTTDLAGHGDGPWYEITAVIDPQRGILRGTMGITCYGLQRMVLRLRPRAGLLDDASLVVTDATILSSSHMPSVIVAMSIGN